MSDLEGGNDSGDGESEPFVQNQAHRDNRNLFAGSHTNNMTILFIITIIIMEVNYAYGHYMIGSMLFVGFLCMKPFSLRDLLLIRYTAMDYIIACFIILYQ